MSVSKKTSFSKPNQPAATALPSYADWPFQLWSKSVQTCLWAAVSIIFLSLSAANAQTFTKVTGTPFPGVYTSSIAFADIDNNGSQDILITGYANTGPIAELYKNDGHGNFTKVNGTPFTEVNESSVAFADIDKNGTQDVLIAGLDYDGIQHTDLYTNDGTGTFTKVDNTPFKGVWMCSVAFADIDNNGTMDVVVSGADERDKPFTELYTNDGTGTFTKVNGTPLPAIKQGVVSFVDIDNNGTMDVFISGGRVSDVITELYKNNGSGQFTKVNTPFPGLYQSSVAFADIDKNGTLDVLIAGKSNGAGPVTQLYTNDGTGTFTKVNGTPFPAVNDSYVAFIDIDKNGTMDAFISGKGTTQLFKNDGTGKFAKVNGTPFPGHEYSYYSSIAFADIDNDTDLDVLITGGFGDFSDLFTNDLPRLTASPTTLCVGASTSLSVVASGGTPPYSYTWATPEGTTLSATNTAVISATATTSGLKTFTVTVAASDGSHINTAMISLTVNAPPTITINGSPSLTIAQGQSANLIASGADSYSWSSGETSAAISVSTAGTYSVTGTTTGGCSATASVVLTLSAPAGLTLQLSASPSGLCQGGTTSLSVVASGVSPLFRYNWQAPKELTVSATNTDQLSVTATTAGIYTFTVTVAQEAAPNVQSRPTSTSTISITVNAPPSLTVTPSPSFTILTGTQATFTASGADTFSWSTGETTAAISVSSAGTYSVTGTTTAGCSATAVATLFLSPGPDLSPTLVIPNGSFPANASRNFVVNLYETGHLPTTSGSVIITVTVPTGYSLSFDQSLTSIGFSDGSSSLVSNRQWSIRNTAGTVQLSLVMAAGQSIPARGTLVIGFTITRTTASSGSTSNMTVNVATDASHGYDVNNANNVYARTIAGL